MYSSKQSVLETVALLKAFGIRDLVISPGSRNAPLALSFAADEAFRCHSVVDERSAGFFALGLIMASQKPVAVCCTSGTALLNYGPAIAEAYYQQLPLIVLSADRPAAWIGQLDGQTLPQPGLFAGLTRASVQIPEIRSDEDRWYVNRLINEALIACTRGATGPVHINIPISEPFSDYSVKALPDVRSIASWTECPAADPRDIERLAQTICDAESCMIVVGQRLPVDDGLNEALKQLSETFGVVVLAEQLSNLSGEHLVGGFDTLLALNDLRKASEGKPNPEGALNIPEDRLKSPDFLLTLGGHVVSKRLKQLLRTQKPGKHLLLTASDETPDTYRSLTDILRANPAKTLQQIVKVLLELTDINKNNISILKRFEYQKHWHRIKAVPTTKAVLKQLPFSDTLVTGMLASIVPAGATIFTGNSSSVRNLQLFELPADCRVFCNRGTSGIEGSLSTACGYASITDEPVFALIGDLSFFYDLSILSRKPFPSNLRILLLNNGGGGIFHTLNKENADENYLRFVAAAHHQEAGVWAQAAGIRHFRISEAEALPKGLEPLLEGLEPLKGEVSGCNDSPNNSNVQESAEDRAILVEVMTPGNRDKQAFSAILNALSINTL